MGESDCSRAAMRRAAQLRAPHAPVHSGQCAPRLNGQLQCVSLSAHCFLQLCESVECAPSERHPAGELSHHPPLHAQQQRLRCQAAWRGSKQHCKSHVWSEIRRRLLQQERRSGKLSRNRNDTRSSCMHVCSRWKRDARSCTTEAERERDSDGEEHTRLHRAQGWKRVNAAAAGSLQQQWRRRAPS